MRPSATVQVTTLIVMNEEPVGRSSAVGRHPCSSCFAARGEAWWTHRSGRFAPKQSMAACRQQPKQQFDTRIPINCVRTPCPRSKPTITEAHKYCPTVKGFTRTFWRESSRGSAGLIQEALASIPSSSSPALRWLFQALSGHRPSSQPLCFERVTSALMAIPGQSGNPRSAAAIE